VGCSGSSSVGESHGRLAEDKGVDSVGDAWGGRWPAALGEVACGDRAAAPSQCLMVMPHSYSEASDACWPCCAVTRCQVADKWALGCLLII
jgi:hypothetical protein